MRRGTRRSLALDRISLTVRRNEFVCVMGPSGCGKTTLLYVIAGIVRPSSGTVLSWKGSPSTGRARTVPWCFRRTPSSPG